MKETPEPHREGPPPGFERIDGAPHFRPDAARGRNRLRTTGFHSRTLALAMALGLPLYATPGRLELGTRRRPRA